MAAVACRAKPNCRMTPCGVPGWPGSIMMTGKRVPRYWGWSYCGGSHASTVSVRLAPGATGPDWATVSGTTLPSDPSAGARVLGVAPGETAV